MRLKALCVGGAALAALVLPLTPASATPGDMVTTTLTQAIADLPVTAESRDGYERSKFRHWVDVDHDGCATRAEVLEEEAVEPPDVGPRCKITGGSWFSWYDGRLVDGPTSLDIDHKVPLAEAWDSGASAWTAQERQDYANDLGEPRALDAVSAQQNRQKADQDPTTWMPSDPSAHCRYIADWAAVKTRWRLSADPDEVAALQRIAVRCPDEEITVVLAR
ncbi:HNH endonuclease [Streptomyces sp. NA02950]|uniref:HNH endonuclease family protein n=1 Tax=Streptomyces sp. NA02950 TaxID=2742137 RepID=UPI00158FD355|nr:HNH endonuclease family protein [Streptomyces sp. NA02950]QKV95966.1 HNH endonuclease [Streptomyces sp. NA02950]